MPWNCQTRVTRPKALTTGVNTIDPESAAAMAQAGDSRPAARVLCGRAGTPHGPPHPPTREQPASRVSIRTRAGRRESHTGRVEKTAEPRRSSMATWQNLVVALDRAFFFRQLGIRVDWRPETVQSRTALQCVATPSTYLRGAVAARVAPESFP